MDGILSFLKPPGITSHDAVGICRRILKERRIGHSGTLDPMAYGVLPVFLGKATRLIEYTETYDKTYVAECRFGTFTDTEDSSGAPVLPDPVMSLRDGVLTDKIHHGTYITEQCPIPDAEELKAVIASFRGTVEQRPSKYSAIKINGVRAYEYARRGIDVTMPVRTVIIKDIEIAAYRFPYVTIRVTCSGGTYIRSLIRDICTAVGIPGTMTQLARTAVGPFQINDSVIAEELMLHKEALLQPPDAAVRHLLKIEVDSVQLNMMVQGKPLPIEPEFSFTEEGHLYRAYGPHGFIGIVKRTPDTIKVEKNIFIKE